jgi:hypothetical protein
MYQFESDVNVFNAFVSLGNSTHQERWLDMGRATSVGYLGVAELPRLKCSAKSLGGGEANNVWPSNPHRVTGFFVNQNQCSCMRGGEANILLKDFSTFKLIPIGIRELPIWFLLL